MWQINLTWSSGKVLLLQEQILGGLPCNVIGIFLLFISRMCDKRGKIVAAHCVFLRKNTYLDPEYMNSHVTVLMFSNICSEWKVFAMLHNRPDLPSPQFLLADRSLRLALQSAKFSCRLWILSASARGKWFFLGFVPFISILQRCFVLFFYTWWPQAKIVCREVAALYLYIILSFTGVTALPWVRRPNKLSPFALKLGIFLFIFTETTS